ELWIDDGAADGLSDLPHGIANSVQQCAAGVFHRVPPVSHLTAMVRRRLGVCLTIAVGGVSEVADRARVHTSTLRPQWGCSTGAQMIPSRLTPSSLYNILRMAEAEGFSLRESINGLVHRYR